MKYLFQLLIVLILVASCQSNNVEDEAKKFLADYDKEYQKVIYEAEEAAWLSNTDIKEENTNKEIEASKKLYDFRGKKEVIEKAQEFLKQKDQLSELTAKQLEVVIYKAAHGPGTIPEVVDALVSESAKLTAKMFGYDYKTKAGKNITPNEIDRNLLTETNIKKRKELWEASKEVGKDLKDGLESLRDLRNKAAVEMGYTSFFDLETADYGMKAVEMKDFMNQVNEEIKPLYAQLYTWVKYELAKKYKQPVPERMPAHWLPNRWSQEWGGIVEGIDLDGLFKDKTPEWIVKQGEKFYVSMGFQELPKSFYEKSDLYPAPKDGSRKKNTHASAWHLNLDMDIRSLMSVENNYRWFGTTHHELGHIYYFIGYSNPNVPLLLREGANRGFHEGVGELINIASSQVPYLKEIGLLKKDENIDQIKWLLNEALENVAFIPFATGTMTQFEYNLYEGNISKETFNKNWWDLVEKYQGIVPPTNRGEEFCDAATKTHIINDPAQYYDYAMAKLIQYQIHNYISANILKTDPHEANYYNGKDVGNYLKGILNVGMTGDWRQLIKEKTGEELSAKAMLEYFQPLMEYLQEANKGREIIKL